MFPKKLSNVIRPTQLFKSLSVSQQKLFCPLLPSSCGAISTTFPLKIPSRSFFSRQTSHFRHISHASTAFQPSPKSSLLGTPNRFDHQPSRHVYYSKGRPYHPRFNFWKFWLILIPIFIFSDVLGSAGEGIGIRILIAFSRLFP